MVEVVGFIAGAVLALGFVRLARSFPPAKARLIYTIGLVLTTLVYNVFSLIGGASTEWLAYEVAGTIVFTAMASAGLRYPLVARTGMGRTRPLGSSVAPKRAGGRRTHLIGTRGCALALILSLRR